MASSSNTNTIPSGQITNQEALSLYNTQLGIIGTGGVEKFNAGFTEEANKLEDNIRSIGQNPTKFVYTSLVVVPILIVLILIPTSHLSIIYKIIDSLLIIVALAFYYFQMRNIDVFTYFKNNFKN
jgi:hypothetical protein